MRAAHLSDEAVAAFADGALSRLATDRARRHVAECAECAEAVAVQREAVWALRMAAPPTPPAGLLDRLRDVPSSTPLQRIPTAFDERGNAMFATGAAAALVPHPRTSRSRPPRSGPESRPDSGGSAWMRPFAVGAAAAAVIGTVAAAGITANDGPTPVHGSAVNAHTVGHVTPMQSRPDVWQLPATLREGH